MPGELENDMLPWMVVFKRIQRRLYAGGRLYRTTSGGPSRVGPHRRQSSCMTCTLSSLGNLAAHKQARDGVGGQGVFPIREGGKPMPGELENDMLPWMVVFKRIQRRLYAGGRLYGTTSGGPSRVGPHRRQSSCMTCTLSSLGNLARSQQKKKEKPRKRRTARKNKAKNRLFGTQKPPRKILGCCLARSQNLGHSQEKKNNRVATAKKLSVACPKTPSKVRAIGARDLCAPQPRREGTHAQRRTQESKQIQNTHKQQQRHRPPKHKYVICLATLNNAVPSTTR